MLDDFELLREHIERGSDEAFQTLVQRHAGMVHGAALRIVRNEQLSEEVTQAVFIILARKAARLRHGTILAGWLYRTTRFVALESLRAEQRRQQQHRRFAEMKDPSETVSIWEQIEPLLDEIMAGLGETDRNALLLRFLEGRTFAEVAGALGTTEAAAKMRVGRALEKLRTALSRRGVVASMALLGTTFAAQGAVVASEALTAKVTTAVTLAQSSLLKLAKGALKIMLWNKIKTAAIATAVLLLMLGGGIMLQQQLRPRPTTSPVVVATFEPMAGEWEGTFESHGDEIPNPVQQPAMLSIRATDGGRSSQIEMHLPDAGVVYRFTHTLNLAGDRIQTMDDPAIGRLHGEGFVTESVNDRKNGQWSAGFRASLPDGGYINCRWLRQGEELIIAREDVTASPQGPCHLFSDLRLRRSPTRTDARTAQRL